MPVKARIDMLSTGIRTPIGIKVQRRGSCHDKKIGAEIEALLPAVRGTRSVFAERTTGGYFLDIVWKRDELARYGLTVEAMYT